MTVFYVISGVGQTCAGFVVDRIGARGVLFAGLALLGISALVQSQAHSYGMLLVGAVLAGLGNCVFHPADFTLLNQRVTAPRLGHAFSSHGISGNLGWAAAPVFMTSLAGLFNWRVALIAAAFVPLTILAVLLIYRNILDTTQVRAAAAAAKKPGASDGHMLGFLKVPGVWMCLGYFLITSVAGGGIQTFSIPGLRDLYGVSLAWATTCFTAYMLASAAGMICGGFVASKTDRPERIIAAAFIMSGMLAFVIASGAMPPMMTVVLMAGIGFGSGIAGPSRDLMIRAAAPKNATGRVYGVVYSGLDLGMMVAPLAFGAMMDSHNPSWVFVSIGVFYLLAILTAITVGTNNARKAVKAQMA
ncbi:MAG: transporter [Noviherbaspirillum sp.]|nr:transporter [Noviherbaspirillum sp.]